eukprot:6491700-Amphidinium_carterae.1
MARLFFAAQLSDDFQRVPRLPAAGVEFSRRFGLGAACASSWNPAPDDYTLMTCGYVFDLVEDRSQVRRGLPVPREALELQCCCMLDLAADQTHQRRCCVCHQFSKPPKRGFLLGCCLLCHDFACPKHSVAPLCLDMAYPCCPNHAEPITPMSRRVALPAGSGVTKLVTLGALCGGIVFELDRPNTLHLTSVVATLEGGCGSGLLSHSPSSGDVSSSVVAWFSQLLCACLWDFRQAKRSSRSQAGPRGVSDEDRNCKGLSRFPKAKGVQSLEVASLYAGAKAGHSGAWTRALVEKDLEKPWLLWCRAAASALRLPVAEVVYFWLAGIRCFQRLTMKQSLLLSSMPLSQM